MGKAGNIFLEGEMDFDRFLPALGNWFHEERMLLASQPMLFLHKPTLMMGVAVWGRKFIDTFLNYCIPTLLTPANLAALNGRLLLVIHVDQDNFEYLKNQVKFLEEKSIDLEIHLIPDHILEMVPERETNKYWLLGTIQHFYLLEAAHKGMNFHMLMPDHIYSEAFFTNLLKCAQEHEIIIQSSINGELERCVDALDKLRSEECIAINAKDLMTLGFENLHEGIKPCIMNGRDAFDNIPVSNYLIWRGENAIYTFSPHASLLYISNRLLRQITLRLHNALDTQIPYYAGSVQPYKPTIRDEIAYIEITEASKGFATQSVGFFEFCFRYWVLTHFNRQYEAIYKEPNPFPVSPQIDFMSEEDIFTSMNGIITALSRTYEAMYAEHEKLEAAA